MTPDQFLLAFALGPTAALLLVYTAMFGGTLWCLRRMSLAGAFLVMAGFSTVLIWAGTPSLVRAGAALALIGMVLGYRAGRRAGRRWSE